MQEPTPRLPRLILIWTSLALAALFWAPMSWAQNRAVDTEGAVKLQGVVAVPSLLAVLFLVVVSVLLALLVTLVVLRAEDRRQAERTRRRLEARIDAQAAELALLRQRGVDVDSEDADSEDADAGEDTSESEDD